MKTTEQIQSRLLNYRETLAGLVTSNQSSPAPSFTEWHKKQIAVLEGKIKELEWLLEGGSDKCIIHSTDWYGKCFKCGEQVFIREDKAPELLFLEERETFQKDENGVYTYFSDNEKHLVNLTALLEDYKTFLSVKQVKDC